MEKTAETKETVQIKTTNQVRTRVQERVLTDEDHQDQAGGVQLDVGVAEGVAEGGVDDHQEDGAADGAERRLPPLQEVPEEPAAHLRHRQRGPEEPGEPEGPRGSERPVPRPEPGSKADQRTYLTQDQRNHDGHEELREDGGEGD